MIRNWLAQLYSAFKLQSTPGSREILHEETANTLSPKSSRLAHLYGFPKTHKATLSMRPILSASGTYNHKLAKWLEENLKPLSIHEYTITDAFDFAD